MNSYGSRQQEKLERYLELAEKADQRSESHQKTADSISSVIPLGQPILVGHHSEKRHRRDLKRIDNHQSKAIEEAKKAEYYRQKADNIQNPKSIASNDPEAIEKLGEKLEEMEELRKEWKAENSQARKQGQDAPHPPYEFQNLGQNIRRVRERILRLKEIRQIEEKKIVKNGITVLINQELNRVQIFFPAIPSQEIRAELKQNGFRWSPRNKVWQRMISSYAIQVAKEIQNYGGD